MVLGTTNKDFLQTESVYDPLKFKFHITEKLQL
jgi:hypothetical protein